MLMQVDYMDQNGSVCYFCGQPLNINKVVEKTYSHTTQRVTSKIYQCTCSQGHLNFIQVHQVVDDVFEIGIKTHLFVFFEDYLEHGGSVESEEIVFRFAQSGPLTEKRKFYYAKKQTEKVRFWIEGQSKKVHQIAIKGRRRT